MTTATTPLTTRTTTRTTTLTTGTAAASGGGRSGTVQLLTEEGWFDVCADSALEPGRGVAALLPCGGQAALFRDSRDRLHAIGNVDPFTGAGVLAHGLLGGVADRPYVASPLLKQRFDLTDGHCLDDDAVRVPAYRVRVV